MMRKLILLLLPMLALAGCIREDDLRFHRVENVSVSIGSTTTVNAIVVVENTSRRNVTLSDAELRVTDMDGNEIGIVTIAGELRIPKRSITDVAVPIRIRLSNPMLGIGLLSDIDRSAAKMKVNGSVRVKAGAMKKNIEVKNMSLSEFLSIFNVQ